ncbi:MAG TPA: glycosyltransferase, partial [Burkholderiaceae bacterium]|nr:glycosyltransferase [Burkholderiaceae bacterium]
MSELSPAASLVLMAYNQAAFARDAALSCLAQVGEPIEIILSDDCSTDDTYAILRQVAAQYRGPHQVRVQQTPRNLGIGGHLNMLVATSRGALIVPAAGDDFSEPDRVQRLLTAWREAGERPDLIATHVREMSFEGQPLDLRRVDLLQHWADAAQWAARRPYIIGAGQAFTRRLVERFGPYQDGVFCEDQINTFRAIVSGGALTLDCAP